MTHTRNAALAVLLATAALAVVATAGQTAATPHHPTDDGEPVNFTWVPAPGGNNHQPGISDASYNSFATSSDPGTITELDAIVIRSDNIDFSGCNPFNARALGIDRDDDDPGTQTDESLVDHLKSNDFREDTIVLTFYDEGSLGGEPVSVSYEDEIVAASSNCFGNPSEPGWYRVHGKINGSAKSEEDGNYYETIQAYSHYTYICDCDSRQEAVEKLGPPPSQQGSDGSGDGGTGGGGGTATPAPTSTATPSSGGGGGGGGDGSASAATATPTPTDEAEHGGGDGSTPASTATPTPGGAGTTTATSDATGTGSAAGSTASGTQGAGTSANGSNGGGGGSSGSSADRRTPSSAGSGPGFGIGAALGALAVAGLFVRHRTD